ncbi:MAG TPA: hypothetical protein VFE07_16320 [Marmoricola sp.]|nr:hypothetical protein [Marmoricola sp.]
MTDERDHGRPGASSPSVLDLVVDLGRTWAAHHDRPDGPSKEIDRLVAQLRTTVAEDPGAHAQAVRIARAEGLELPWDRINSGMARDLAVLHNFVPFIDTSGLVAARRLREWGVLRDVVSQDLSHRARVDDDAMRICAEVVDRTRILPGKRLDHRWRASVRFTEGTLAAVAELEAGKGRPYRSVYSRAMPPASHVAAAVLKLRSPDLRWIAEFSDPLLMNAYGEVRNGEVGDDWLRAELVEGFRRYGHAVPETERLFGWAEMVAYAFADEIVFTNAHQRDFMLGYTPDGALAERARSRTTVLHHPVPDAALYSMKESSYSLAPGKVHIGFFGNFYPNRSLVEVTGALERLSDAERARLQLHIFTSRSTELDDELRAQGLSDVVSVQPMQGFLEYLNLLRRFDALLINDYATSPHYVPNPYLPAKLSDYLGSGRPIWALYEPGSVLGATAGVAYRTVLGDVDAATKVLRELAAGTTPSAARPG